MHDRSEQAPNGTCPLVSEHSLPDLSHENSYLVESICYSSDEVVRGTCAVRKRLGASGMHHNDCDLSRAWLLAAFFRS